MRSWSDRVLPSAIMLFSPDLVPQPLHSRLNDLVRATWRPGGIDDSLASAELDGCEILITGARHLPAKSLARLPRLRLVITTGTAFDYVDVDYCRSHKICVCNTPGYTGSAVAEHAFGLFLVRAKHLSGRESVSTDAASGSVPVSLELEGKTAGIVGMGDVGRRVARLAYGFGMNVIYATRTRRSFANARQVDLQEIFSTSDVVFLTLPLTAATRNLVDDEQFSAMKRGSFLVNVSAAGLVNEGALLRALVTRRVAGAALDVVDPSPALSEASNLTVTEGRGWRTAEGMYRRAGVWLDTLEAFIRNEPRNVV